MTEAPASQNVLSLSGVGLRFASSAGAVDVLDSVNFEVGPGERVAVTGPSGSGKSSLLAVSAGLEKASEGTVRLLGQDITRASEGALAALRRGRVGFVFQSFHLMPAMTALENVMAALEIAAMPNARVRAAEALRAVGLSARLDHRPGQLSGGERQRVAIARALVVDPAIVFADEPTGNLDGKAGRAAADLLFETVARSRAAMVLVTHDPRLASRADRVCTMSDGRLSC